MKGPGTLVALLTLVAGTAACGYALAGRGNALPSHIRSIGVPNFVNHTTIPEIELALSDAVRAELVSRGRYLVQPASSGVDAVLTGVVVSADQRPLTFTANNQAASRAITVTSSVEFKDLIDDKVLWTNPTFRSSDEYQVPAGTSPSDLNALFTQLPTARERLAKKFSKEVVSSIFEAF
jgi:outer membrane lipopolysaccharide assembly protein LptE/RlpB